MTIPGIDPELYDELRMAMFGQESLAAWDEDELRDFDSFADWAIERTPLLEDIREMGYDYTESEVRTLLKRVWLAEYTEYQDEEKEE